MFIYVKCRGSPITPREPGLVEVQYIKKLSQMGMNITIYVAMGQAPWGIPTYYFVIYLKVHHLLTVSA